MDERTFNPFRGREADEGSSNVRLAIARNLARIYADVLHDPLPENLRYLIEKWESRDGREGLRQAQTRPGQDFCGHASLDCAPSDSVARRT